MDKLKQKRTHNKNANSHKQKLSIDHKYSILEGFKNKISPEITGLIVNLCLITISKNSSRGAKCNISLQTLIKDYNNFINENKINKTN